jgi:hypothetical protein
MRKTPWHLFGVKLVFIYQILRGAIALVFGFLIVVYLGPSNRFASLAAKGNAIERCFSQLGHAAGVFVFVFAMAHMLAGYGVLRMQNWGRLVTMLLSGAELLMFSPVVRSANVFALAFAMANAACFLYLLMPGVRRVFQAKRDGISKLTCG